MGDGAFRDVEISRMVWVLFIGRDKRTDVGLRPPLFS